MGDKLFTGAARPQVFLPGTVYDAALKRIRWLFDEFDGKVCVSTSGGKDSTVVKELALIVARERGEAPLKIHFLDQEGEYRATIEYMRRCRARAEDFDLTWYQVPFWEFNAANHDLEWTRNWDERLTPDQWMRPKEPGTVHENDYRDGRGKLIDNFKPLLSAINTRSGGVTLTGMRCEESPSRRVFMTSAPAYKWATWGSRGKNGAYYLMNPIYDWSYRDVWAAIERGGWDYNDFYDSLYRHGAPLRKMRVSCFHHEDSIGSTDFLQEIEPDTWEKAVQRLPGLNSVAHTAEDQWKEIQTLPYMFASWDEYLDHLIEKLVTVPENRATFRSMKERALRACSDFMPRETIVKQVAHTVWGNDTYGSTLDKWIVAQRHPSVREDWLRFKREAEARERQFA